MTYVTPILCSGIVLGFLLFRRFRQRPPYPPGPSGYPLIGNLLDIPSENEWITYREWSDLYKSEIVHASFFGSHIVVVNSARVARELFDRRSSIYSDRPHLRAISDLLECNFVIAFMRYGSWWRDHRKAVHRWFHPDAVMQYREKEQKAVQHLLSNLLLTPEQFYDHVQLLTGRLIIDVAYGVEVKNVDHPYVENAERFMKGINYVGSTRGLMHDFFPLLSKIPSWAPSGGINKSAREFASYGSNVINLPFEHVKSMLESSGENYSVAADCIKQAEKLSEHDLILMKNSLASMYLDGVDTTTSTFRNFFRAMALFPYVQRRAQEEIDTVTESKRLPTFGDMESLPYVKALCLELLRWQPISTLGVPHVLTEEDYFEGYIMPKNATVIGNIGAMLHDDFVYPNPSTFYPERFLGPNPNPEPDFAFGFGRRVCPGRYLARESIWITVACILACFDISKAKDEDGVEIEISLDQTGGLTHQPVPFKCSIRVRDVSFVSFIKGP